MSGNAEVIQAAVTRALADAPAAGEAPEALASLIQTGLAKPTADAAAERQEHDRSQDPAA